MEEKSKRGRPVKQLDEQQIIELAKIDCTFEEIAAVMKCSTKTLQRNYVQLIKEAREVGKKSLRRYMWDNAKKGNVSMQIWLSKQVLGMREPQIIEIVREEAKGIFNQFFDSTTKV